MIEPCSLGAKEAAVRIERGELSARSLIESCLERIGEDARTLACARWIEARTKENR